MGAALIEKKNGQIVIAFRYAMAHQARTMLQEKSHQLSHATRTRTWWWRATNNKSEDLVCSTILSVNHADGSAEVGISVSEHTGYQTCFGYKYIYPITGELAGIGSDGEPVLRNARALSKPARTPSKKWMEAAASMNQCPAEATYDLIGHAQTEYRESIEDGERIILNAGF